MSPTRIILVVVTCFLGLVAAENPSLGQSIRYVDDDAPQGGNGQSWETAYQYLQDALAEATAPGSGVTEIRVAGGTYKPDQGQNKTPGDRTATFQLINGVALRGGYAGLGATDPDARDITANETILSGDLAGDDRPSFANNGENSFHVVMASGTDATALLEGVTITAGNANGAAPANDGAGIHNEGGSFIVSRCIVKGNAAQTGAGMYNKNATPTISECVFQQNSATISGGGILNDHSSAMIRKCVFSENQAFASGAGIMNAEDSNGLIVNCVLRANVATTRYGGGIYIATASPTLMNCVLSGNRARSAGGGMFNFGSQASIINCTLYGNQATNTLGGICNYVGCAISVSNCILWANQDRYGTGFASQISMDGTTLNYSCIQGWSVSSGGIGNIGSDPKFQNAAGSDGIPGTADDDLRLQLTSPCADAGSNSAVPADVGDLDDDGDTQEPVPLDQGQRTLNPLCGKDFHEELVVPAGDLALSLDAVV